MPLGTTWYVIDLTDTQWDDDPVAFATPSFVSESTNHITESTVDDQALEYIVEIVETETIIEKQ